MKISHVVAAAFAAASLVVPAGMAFAQEKPAAEQPPPADKAERGRNAVHMHRAEAASYAKGTIISSVDRERRKKEQLDIISTE